MKNKIIALSIIVSFGLGLGTNAVVKNSKHSTPAKPAKAVQKVVTTPSTVTKGSYEEVKSLDVAANPSKYLNKRIKIKAKFDKFSTLGLDYKPAFRSSEKYITFLIKRDDVTDHTIPLSEMKIFMQRDEAEKYIDLSAGDAIEFSGYVFSNALGDPWIEVEKFTVLSSKPKADKTIKK